jgi:hypothetical protein
MAKPKAKRPTARKAAKPRRRNIRLELSDEEYDRFRALAESRRLHMSQLAWQSAMEMMERAEKKS